MIFTGKQYFTSTINVLDGTLKLAGGLNTMYAAASGMNFNLAPGATLDLNGNTQFIKSLGGPGGAPGGGGSIITSAGTGTLVTFEGATWGGVITGAINLAKFGSNQTISNANPYTGWTLLGAGTTTLQDDGSLLNTSAIGLNYAGLTLGNNSNLQRDNANRLNDVAPITMKGGTLTFTGRVSALSSETVGAVTAAVGANTITTGNGGLGSGGFANAVLTIASLSRSAGTTVNFTSSSGALGAPGNNASILFSSPLTTVGKGVLGAWAIANTTDYAAYNSTNGVGVVGAGGFAAYDAGFGSGNITNLGGTALANVTTNLPAGTTTTGLLRFQGGFTNDLTFTNAADVLHLELGGILRSNNNNPTTIGTAATRGVITSGLNELVVYHNQNTLTINSVIQGATALVKSGAGTLALSAPNTYSLGTVVNQGTVTLNAPGTGGIADHVVIPNGGLMLAGATVTMVTNSGQIGSGNSVTLDGSSTLTLVGNNTLVGLSFNNTGGTTNPSVASGGTLTLSSSTPITATSNNPNTTATVSGTVFLAAGGTNTFNIGAITHDGTPSGTLLVDSLPSLNVSAVISGPAGTSLSKTGTGLLQLSGANTFDGGVSVTAGGIVLGSNSVGLDNGPLGTGSAVFANGTSLFVDNNSRTLANAVNFAGNPTFSNTGTTLRTLTLNGDLDFDTLTTTGLVIDLPTPYLDLVLGGILESASSITAIGSGSGANTLTKTGLGNITGINLTGVNPAITINVAGLNNSATAFSLLLDGDGTVRTEALNIGAIVTAGAPSLIIGRSGTSYLPLFTTALNKTLQPASITNLGSGITLTNSNGYWADSF